MERGQIVTFYSYKGGVGRSFALANTAVLLARWGYHVLCVDWDLEAPGLSYFFDDFLDEPPQSGLLEMIEEARDEPGREDTALRHRTTVTLPGDARLDLIAAGKQEDKTYISRLQKVDWEELYAEHDFGATLEVWRDTWMREYDIVLVDSRTGITDSGGICTAQVPDVLVFAFTANQQNVDGVLDIVERAMQARDGLPYDRPRLLTVPLLSRFDAQPEYEQGETWRRELAQRMQPRLRDWAPRGSAAGELLQRVTIPYFPIWSFGESLPALIESHRNSEQVTYSIASLAALLARRLEDVGLLIENRDSYVESAVQAARRGYDADVFLSYGAGTEALARELIPLLNESGVTTHPATTADRPPSALARRAQMDASRHLVVLADEDPNAEQEQDIAYFLRRSVNATTKRFTLPVVTSSEAFRNLPPLVQNLQFFNLARASVPEAARTIVTQIRDGSGHLEFGAPQPARSSRFDVFLSYVHEDEEWALALAENLRRLGLDVWLDQWETAADQPVATRLAEGLARAEAVIAVVSPRWIGSGWCNEEFAAAMMASADGRQRLIPVLWGDVSSVPPFVASRLFVDFRAVATPTAYEQRVRQLARLTLGRDPDRPLLSPALSVPDASVLSGDGPVHGILRVDTDEVVFTTLSAETTFTPDHRDRELDRLLWELRRARAGGAAATDLTELLRWIGSILGDGFAGGSVGSALGAAIESARTHRTVLRLAIQVNDPRLADLPWETLRLPGTDQALALTDGAELYRQVRRGVPPVVTAVPGPLRILAVVASPEVDGGELLDYERELACILDAVGSARTQQGAHVRLLNWGSVREIRAALEEERFHVLHLSCHAGPGVLYLERDDGSLDAVDAQRFMDELLPLGRAVPLVVLTGSSTARAPQDTADGAAGTRTSLARELMARGLPGVLAMTEEVTERYATELAALLYEELARAEHPVPLAALSRARRRLETARQQLPAGDPRAAWPEWSAPSLFLAGPPLPLFDAGQTFERVTSAPEVPLEEGMVLRKVGEFVGRRAELRQLLAALHDSTRAGVLIHGIGGVGKSTLAAELLHHLGAEAGLVVPLPAAAAPTVDSLLETLRKRLVVHCVSAGLAEDDSLRRVAVGLVDAKPPWRERWALIQQTVLPRLPVLLMLDNAEDLLAPSDEGRQLADPDLADFLAAWLAAAPRARLIVTSRYPFSLPKRRHRRLTAHHLGPLSFAETRKLIWRLPALDALGPQELHRAYTNVGGHPRALEYLDAMLRGGQARFPDIADRMEEALERRGVRDPERWLAGVAGDLDKALAETVTLAADDVLLDTLLGQLKGVPSARVLLAGLSVFRIPVDLVGAAWQLSGPDVVPDAGPDAGPAEPERLAALSARVDAARVSGVEAADLQGPPTELVDHHAQGVRELPGAPVELDDVGSLALQTLLELGLVSPAPAPQDPSGSKPNGLLVHPWTADAIHRRTAPEALVAAHRRAAAYWRWRADSVPQDAAVDVAHLIEARHHHRQADDLDQVDVVTRRVCGQLNTWGAWDWEERLLRETLAWLPRHSRAAAFYIHQLGVIAQVRGEYAQAEDHFREALALNEELGDRYGITAGLHRLGTIAQDRGDHDTAEQFYRHALSLAEELGDRGDLAAAYHQLGTIAQDRGDYATAEEQFHIALSIAEELSDRVSIANTYHRLGMLAHHRGHFSEAERFYRQALTITEEVGNRVGTAGVHHQLGRIAQERGEYDTAEHFYRNALTINEELGNRQGLANTLSQLGVLHTQLQQPELGIPYTLQALVLRLDMGVPPDIDLGSLTRQRAALGNDAFRGVLAELVSEEDAEVLLDATEQLRDTTEPNGPIPRM